MRSGQNIQSVSHAVVCVYYIIFKGIPRQSVRIVNICLSFPTIKQQLIQYAVIFHYVFETKKKLGPKFYFDFSLVCFLLIYLTMIVNCTGFISFERQNDCERRNGNDLSSTYLERQAYKKISSNSNYVCRSPRRDYPIQSRTANYKTVNFDISSCAKRRTALHTLITVSNSGRKREGNT